MTFKTSEDSRLTNAKCEDAARALKSYKLFDGGALYLYVAARHPRSRASVDSGKSWRFDYSYGGKRKTLTIGKFPGVSLGDARRARDIARAQLEDGIDPMAEKKVAKLTRAFTRRQTFGLVAEELIEKMEREGKAESTIKKRKWLLNDLAADLTERPVSQITPAEVLAVLRKAESRGHLESARRLRASIGQVMRLAVATNRATSDPTPALRGAIAVPKVKHRAAITTPQAAGKLMDAIAGYEGAAMRCALLIAAYCFPRPGELRLALWDEIDIRGKLWTIPAARTKMRREHRVPLSPQAVRQFNALRKLTGENVDGYCFPGLRSGRPMSENAINAALRTLGYDGNTHVAHGFRAMASTILNEHSQFSADAIERALGHMEVNGVRRAYHRAEYWEERVKIMDWYAAFLDKRRNRAHNDRLLG